MTPNPTVVSSTHLTTPARQGGFTLIEIMVVIVILGLLATIVVPEVLGMGEEAKVQVAETNAKAIYEAAKLYKLKNGSTPTLEQLMTPDEKGKTYLDESSDSRDPWDIDYVIRDTEAGKFEVLSCGPDKSEGTEDDVVIGRPKPR